MGQGGRLAIINNTRYDMVRGHNHSYQMKAWKFPEKIAANSCSEVYVEFESTFFSDMDDAGEQDYVLAGINHIIELQARGIPGGYSIYARVKNLVPEYRHTLGWLHDGTITFVVSEENGLIVFSSFYGKAEGLETVVNLYNNTKANYRVEADFDNIFSTKGQIPGGLDGITDGQPAVPKSISLMTGALGRTYFTLHIVDDSGSRVADLEFLCLGSETYRLNKHTIYNDDVPVDVVVEAGRIDVFIEPAALCIGKDGMFAGFPAVELNFNPAGDLVDEKEGGSARLDLFKKRLEQEGITDLILFAHGFNNTPAAARSFANKYFKHFRPLPHKKVAICSIVWYSQFSDKGDVIANVLKQLTFGKVKFSAIPVAIKIADLLNRYFENSLLNIHLAGHSMGCVLMTKVVEHLTAGLAKSVFLIQPAMNMHGFNQLELKVDGPVAASYSRRDGQVGELMTLGVGLLESNSLGEALEGAGKAAVQFFTGNGHDGMGIVGMEGGTVVKMQRQGFYPKFHPQKKYSIEAMYLANHNDFRNMSFACAHMALCSLIEDRETALGVD